MADAFDPYHRWLGIAPKDQPANHYRLLGLELFESDPEVIDSAADRQMAHVRTFQSGPHSVHSQKVLNALSTARLCLLNSQKRLAYDQALQAKLDAAMTSPATESPALSASTSQPSTPAIETIPLAPMATSAPPPLPSKSGSQIRHPNVVQAQTAASAPNVPARDAAGNSAMRRASNLPIILSVAGIGFAFLLVSAIAGVLIWSRLNRNPENELAAGSDPNVAISNRPTPSANHRSAFPTTTSSPQKSTASPGNVNSPGIRPPAMAGNPPAQPNIETALTKSAPIIVTASPNAIVPREIKLPKRGSEPKFTPDSSLLLYFSSDRIEIWNLADEKVVGTIVSALPQFAISPDGKKLAVELYDNLRQGSMITIFDLATQTKLRQLPHPPNQFAGTSWFRVCGFDGTSNKLFVRTNLDLQVWDVETGEMLRRVNGVMSTNHNASVSSANGRFISVNNPLSSVLDTEAETVTRIEVHPDQLTTLLGRHPTSWGSGSWSFSGDGQRLYGVDSTNGIVLQWTLPEVRLSSGLVIQDLHGAIVSPDETRILARLKNAKETLYVLDATLQAIATLKASSGSVVSYAISPNNRWVVMRGAGESRLFDLGRQPAAKN